MVKYNLDGTKAETLKKLESAGFNIPRVYFFTVAEWYIGNKVILDEIIIQFKDELLAVRSSSKAEDTPNSSMAGVFESILNVYNNKIELIKAIESVISSFDNNPLNQILIQPMVTNVAMSGVIMSKVLDDGSPYYVINYDDKTGLTDTVTSGSAINKTVYIYNGVDKKDFDSPYLLRTLNLVRKLEKTFPGIPLDIEFAIDNDLNTHLFQVRRITTTGSWKNEINEKVSERILFLKEYIEKIMRPRPKLYGEKTLLGFMPDWNPAEMIGVVPHPLSLSLYRTLITRSTWRIAREKMGYRKMPNVDLMVSLFGRVYIDVRNSINSFLPSGIDKELGDKIVNAYIKRLDKNPHLHDKIEFEVVHTAYDFNFNKDFKERHSDLLTDSEFIEYRNSLKNLTKKAINNSKDNSLNVALKDIEKLKSIQQENENINMNSFAISDKINSLIADCIEYGTLPFSILARHGFIAEGILRSAVNCNAISEYRLQEFRKSIVTVSGKMSNDFSKVLNFKMTKVEFINRYGHLRPSSYDILSPNYSDRKDIFEVGDAQEQVCFDENFSLSMKERKAIETLLNKHGFNEFTPEDILTYARRSIEGREYAKFIFTKSLSQILELVACWGKTKDFNREDMSMLTIDEVLSVLFAPLRNNTIQFFKERIKNAKNNFEVATSFKLSYLIRSERDVYIVPMQRSAPNFIGSVRLEAKIIELQPYQEIIPELKGKIICIEGADPGYDWIFTRNIAGLITKYGGSNSHMAIRSAEYGIPAAIGCGEQTYLRITKSEKCLLDCLGKRLEPILY